MAHGLFEALDRTILLALHTSDPPSDEEWGGYLDMLRRSGEAVQWDLSRLASLVVTDGGAPATAQRTPMNNLLAQGKRPPRSAVVTGSVAVRSLSRAMVLFNPMYKVFSPEQLPAALSFLGLVSWQRDLIAALRRLEAEQLATGAVQTLARLGRSAR